MLLRHESVFTLSLLRLAREPNENAKAFSFGPSDVVTKVEYLALLARVVDPAKRGSTNTTGLCPVEPLFAPKGDQSKYACGRFSTTHREIPRSPMERMVRYLTRHRHSKVSLRRNR